MEIEIFTDKLSNLVSHAHFHTPYVSMHTYQTVTVENSNSVWYNSPDEDHDVTLVVDLLSTAVCSMVGFSDRCRHLEMHMCSCGSLAN